MSKFLTWFNSAYKRWIRSQPGGEDFLAFCDLLGYPPAKVLDWLHGESIPEGLEVLSIAGLLGVIAYETLDLPAPDPGLIKIYQSLAHLNGEYRCKLAYAFWEAQEEMRTKEISSSSEEAKAILGEAFKKWGFES